MGGGEWGEGALELNGLHNIPAGRPSSLRTYHRHVGLFDNQTSAANVAGEATAPAMAAVAAAAAEAAVKRRVLLEQLGSELRLGWRDVHRYTSRKQKGDIIHTACSGEASGRRPKSRVAPTSRLAPRWQGMPLRRQGVPTGGASACCYSRGEALVLVQPGAIV